MKTIAIVIAGVAALIGPPALAADLPVKAPPPAAIRSWTGFYVGGNVGYGWGDAHTDVAGNGAANFDGVQFPPITFADSQRQRLTGAIAGAQVGYNYQVSPRWLLGFEADIQGSGQRGSTTLTDSFSGAICAIGGNPLGCVGSPTPLTGTAVTSYQGKIETFGTVRGRLGVLIDDNLLAYGTGGLAYGHVSVTGNVDVSAIVAPIPTVPFFGPAITGFSQSRTNTGFAAGGGLEGRFSAWVSPDWRWKFEYLYVDLGSLDASTSFAAAPARFASPGITPLAGPFTAHTRFTDNIVRVGLNYQFH